MGEATLETPSPARETRRSVQLFAGTLPNMVAGHPEGQEAIKTVMQMLEKLDQAAKMEHTANLPAAGASATAPAHADGDTSSNEVAGRGRRRADTWLAIGVERATCRRARGRC